MKIACIVAIAAICVTGCARGEPSKPITIETKVTQIATAMRGVLPKTLNGGMSFDAVSAEGDTLVLAIRGIPEWRPSVTDAEAGKLFSASICKSAQIQNLVKEGAHLRIDGTTPEGKKLPSLPICQP